MTAAGTSLAVEPFTIHVEEEVLDDLRARLRNRRGRAGTSVVLATWRASA